MTSQLSLAASPPQSDPAAKRPLLHAVGEKFLPSRCRPRTLSYCPTMDLVAVVTVLNLPGDGAGVQERLGVWRLNGQQVFAWDATATMGIPFVGWKADGRLIAVGTSDGVVRLLNVTNGGKLVHCLGTQRGASTGGAGPVLSCLTLGVNFGDIRGMRDGLADSKYDVSISDLLSSGGGIDGILKTKASLPRELACGMDIEATIPKLSALPAGTGAGGGWGFGGGEGDDDVFSSRASMDAIFHSHSGVAGRSNRHDEVDVLVNGFEDGTIYIRIFDCFDIGKVDLTPSLPKDGVEHTVLQYVVHPLSSTHAAIVRTKTAKGAERLCVVAIHLNFISHTSPYYLSTVATKSTQLFNLLRYLAQVSMHLSIEFRGAFDLPSKFIRNINETLKQNPVGPLNFVTAAYQLVVAGECGNELRDWMVEEIGERNLKRWEKASMNGLEAIRRLVHESLLPALERCQVVLSRLDGLSRFAKSAQVLGLDKHSLDRVMDMVGCFHLLSHYLLKTVGREIKQFAAFMKWLRLEVEIQGLERENAGGPGSERLDDLCMRRDEIEARSVLEYIRGVMTQSGIASFVRPSVDARGSSLSGPPYDWSQSPGDVGFYEVFKKMLKADVEPGKRPLLDDLLRKLNSFAETIFDGIAQTLRKNILHSTICTLSDEWDGETLIARMLHRDGDGSVVILATRPKKTAIRMALHQISLDTAQRNGIPEVKDFKIPGGESMVDMKFADDTELMMLSSGQDGAHLRSLDYVSPEAEWQERHFFDLQGGINPPCELEVNGRKGRRAVCVLGSDSKFTVFDLDSGQTNEDMVANDEDEDEDVLME